MDQLFMDYCCQVHSATIMSCRNKYLECVWFLKCDGEGGNPHLSQINLLVSAS